jgi:MAF protein
VLASASPRRRELLDALRLRFTVVAADLDEATIAGTLPPADAARTVAVAKALAVAAQRPGDVVLAADTMVVVDDLVLGKPVDPADARRMLRVLRNRAHLVLTAVTVRSDAHEDTAVVSATVRMRDYSDAEIDRYVDEGTSLDRAGAYGIQDEPFRPVAAIEGCWCNVMGLPLWTAARLLSRAGCVAGRAPDAAFARCAVCPSR